MSGTSETATIGLQLIDIEQLAAITGLSKPTLWRHNEAGLIPPGMKIGRAVRWRLVEIESWIEAGCPRCDEADGQDRDSLSDEQGVRHGA